MAAFPAIFGLLMAGLVSGQNIVEITPREAVRRVGDELTVLCKVPYRIDSCRMTIGTTPYRLIPGNQEGDVIYSGQGLDYGECGAHIRNIREEWNGNISCVLPPQTGSIEVPAYMRLIVAKAPGEPTLISPSQPVFREGDIFLAQCVVPDGRPAAKITWYLDEEPLLEGVHQPIISEPGSDLQTITENITRTMRADDNNRMLICKAEHEALDMPREAKRQLVVHYPPTRLESGTITIFGLKLGAEGKLNVTLRSNPPPVVEWTVGELKLTASQTSEDGRLAAFEPLHLGGGFYNVSLLLGRIAKEDVDRTYYLRVSNDLGREEFAVRISTMDEPAGVELDTGAIVGIVVAVLILLIALFLGVFAFATDRWCFAGRGRDRTKNSGESNPAGDVLIEPGIPLPSRTDTESAVGGRERSRLANLGARMMAVLPRAKDKVQATETQAVDAEEKLGGLVIIGLGITVLVWVGDLTDILPINIIPISLIVLGVVIFVISFLACCGAIKESRCMLITYAISMAILAAFKIYLTVLIFNSLAAMQQRISRWLNHAFENATLRPTFHVMEALFSCCGTTGSSSYQDFNLPISPSCCANPVNNTCPAANTFSGCTNIVTEYFDIFGEAIGSVLIVIIVVEIVAIVLAWFFSDSISKKRRGNQVV